MNLANFDAAAVDWQPLPGPDGNPADHIEMSIVNVDDDAKIVDVLFKFAANEKILLHRHTSNFNTFVVQGEHRIYEPDGALKETRPAGTYKASVPDAEPHQEGGGDEDVVILFSLRPYLETKPIYKILDDDHQIASLMTFDDLKAVYQSLS
mgnify:FL=1